MLALLCRSGVSLLLIAYLTQFLGETYCEQDVLPGRSWKIERHQTRTYNHENHVQDATRAKRVNRAVSNKGKEKNEIHQDEKDDQDECYDDFITDCLQTHDMYRAWHGVAPLEANKKLMDYAQKRANKLAETDSLEHPADSPYGENLAYHSQKKSTCGDLVKMWYDENESYDYQNPGFDGATGHFTQLVWKDSARIGCARSFSNKGVYLACNYDPPGNVMGQFKDQVPPPKDGAKENKPPANKGKRNCRQTNS